MRAERSGYGELGGLVSHGSILAFSLIKMRQHWSVLNRGVRLLYGHFTSITLAIMGRTDYGKRGEDQKKRDQL